MRRSIGGKANKKGVFDDDGSAMVRKSRSSRVLKAFFPNIDPFFWVLLPYMVLGVSYVGELRKDNPPLLIKLIIANVDENTTIRAGDEFSAHFPAFSVTMCYTEFLDREHSLFALWASVNIIVWLGFLFLRTGSDGREALYFPKWFLRSMVMSERLLDECIQGFSDTKGHSCDGPRPAAHIHCKKKTESKHEPMQERPQQQGPRADHGNGFPRSAGSRIKLSSCLTDAFPYPKPSPLCARSLQSKASGPPSSNEERGKSSLASNYHGAQYGSSSSTLELPTVVSLMNSASYRWSVGDRHEFSGCTSLERKGEDVFLKVFTPQMPTTPMVGALGGSVNAALKRKRGNTIIMAKKKGGHQQQHIVGKKDRQ
ncbi:hypothetical protein cyc_07168 [Cyclospora cayetanensis]|uniref:Uncharacterized protein n=1 Tax=Cyclospora cayetanensis TaxID=88456 RepID=A0A1D3CUB8_9EIME|nr:hypothetical protein cyc_07168 [Cyclospora cayetanensis]